MLSMLLLLSQVNDNHLLWLLTAFTAGLRTECLPFLLVSKYSRGHDKLFFFFNLKFRIFKEAVMMLFHDCK
jgi:hypothetical protein